MNADFVDEIIFDVPAPVITIPDDDLSPSKPSPGTILYLTISTPHTDTFAWHGPFTSLPPILKLVRDLVSKSVSANVKLQNNLKSIEKNGITQFVIEGSVKREDYTVLRIVREVNKDVCEQLPTAVFTVMSSGPLLHDINAATGKIISSNAKGKASTSTLIGTFMGRVEARACAEATMTALLAVEPASERPKPTSEFPSKDAGAGLILAMNHRARWEVRVFFPQDALRGAKERFDADEKNVEKGRTASWRMTGY